MLQTYAARWAAAVIGVVLAGPSAAGAADIQPAQDIFTRPLPQSDLDSRRAGDSTVIQNHIDMTGTTDHINVQNSASGNNSIGGGSFSNAQGFPIVIQNSGNGVLIQNATIINMTVKP